MKKIFIANLASKTISLSLVDLLAKKSSLLQEFNWQGNNFLLTKRLKELLKREKKNDRNLYVVLNNEKFVYHRYVADVRKTRDELMTLLELTDNNALAYQEKKNGDDYIYFGLSINKNILEKYTVLLKKLELNSLAVLPLDLILLQKKQAGIYLEQEQEEEITFKIIDQTGNYYRKNFINEAEFDKNKERLLIYLKREKIVSEMEDLSIIEADRFLNQDLFVGINFLEESNFFYKKRINNRFKQGLRLLTFKQKLLLLFIAAVIASILISVAFKTAKILRINHDIAQYTQMLSANATAGKDLLAMEKNTRYFRSLANKPANLPLIVVQEAALADIGVKKILQYQDKALAFTGIDRGEKMAGFIKNLKKNSAVTAVNLVDVAYYKNHVEFKLVITGIIRS